MPGIVRLIHPFPVLMVLLAAASLLVIAHRSFPSDGLFVRAMLVVLLSQIAVGALNDYIDRHADAKTQPDKPIPAGLVPAGLALGLALGATGGVLLVAATFGLSSLLLAAAFTGAGLAYDLWLKPTPMSFVAYVVAFLLLVTWIWVITGSFRPEFTVIYLPGALLLTCAHLANALEDIETDGALGQRGLAVVLGPRQCLRAMKALYFPAALMGAAVCLRAESFFGLLFVMTGAAIASVALSLGRRSVTQRSHRLLVFRLMAPAIGLVGLGTLLGVTKLL